VLALLLPPPCDEMCCGLLTGDVVGDGGVLDDVSFACSANH
jgi:hypothetical protein